MTLTAAELREILCYDPETGVFTRRIQTSKRIKPGDVCKTVAANGYVIISVKARRYTAHRLAWLYVHGEWPIGMLDHVNGVRTDNRIANLRLATQHQQNGNLRIRSDNKSGFKGVCWDKRQQRWRVTLCGKHIGQANTKEEAARLYDEAARRVFGEFARPNEVLVSRVPASNPETPRGSL